MEELICLEMISGMREMKGSSKNMQIVWEKRSKWNLHSKVMEGRRGKHLFSAVTILTTTEEETRVGGEQDERGRNKEEN